MSMEQVENPRLSRRTFIKRSLQVALGAAVVTTPVLASAGIHLRRSLSLYHTHTKQHLDIVYAYGQAYDPAALEKINYFLRDFRTGETYPIDTELLDILWRLQQDVGGKGVYEVISGYRSPLTNQNLRQNSNGVAKKSLHMEGRAIDIRFSQAPTKHLQQCAKAMQCGGVGYYPESDFVHIDTGRVRFW